MKFLDTFGGRRLDRNLVRALLLTGMTAGFLTGCTDTDPTGLPERYYQAEESGFDVGRLFYALDKAQASGTVQGLVVERYGTVVAEAYNHETPHWTLFETWFVTSAVMSLLVGQALETGDLTSLDQTLGELLVPWDDHLDEEKARITIRQLLTMTSGISRPYGTAEEYFDWLDAPDQVAWVLEHPLRSAPGERYRSDSAAAHLLAAALAQATGKSPAELAQDVLLDPLGIGDSYWMADSNGISYGGFGLHVRTRDMVKLARLVLDGGSFDGQQVVSTGWIEESTRPHVHPYPDYPDWGFGYLWKSTVCSGYACLYASGFGGQILVAVPELDLAIAVNSAYSTDEEEADRNADIAWDIVLNQVIPSVRN
jgi:CubicO group peptidase (beta-lactamase class C family)